MDTKYLPGGGAKFSLVKFSDRLKGTTKYSPLRSRQDSIMKVVRQASSRIRGGDFDSVTALRQLKTIDKDLSRPDLRAAGKILKHLEDSADPVRPAKSAPAASAGAEALKSVRIGINRDPNFQMDYKGLSVQQQKAGSFAVRGVASRAALTYEKMTKLGGSDAARNLQKSAFSKMQQTGQGTGLRGGAGTDRSGLTPGRLTGGQPLTPPADPFGHH